MVPVCFGGALLSCGFSIGRSGFPSPTCSTSDQSAPVQNFILSSRRGTNQARIRTKPEKLWEKRQTTCRILNRTVCNTRDGSFMTHISPLFPKSQSSALKRSNRKTVSCCVVVVAVRRLIYDPKSDTETGGMDEKGLYLIAQENR